MDDISVIDHFLDVFSRYIDSGFGLLRGEVAYLTATLIAIDMALAGLFWAMGHATGHGDDVMAKLLRKVLYVGAFAYIIGNFNRLAGIVFHSFAGLGLVASGSGMSESQFLQPGRLAKVGIDAGRPIMAQIGDLTGFPEVYAHLDIIAVLFLAWIVLVVAFFILSVQLFVTLLEFKLTTLAGFVLVPFALWNKTAFLAEKVLGNIISSGVRVLVLAVIVGIGTGLFSEFTVPTGADPSIDHALVVMLAALTMLGLGIFGPGIATGLVSGAPQLGAGAAAGTAIGVAGLGVAAGAATVGAGSAIAAGARMAPLAARSVSAGGASTLQALHPAGALARSAEAVYQTGANASGATGLERARAGFASVAKTGSTVAADAVATRAQAFMKRGSLAEFRSHDAAGAEVRTDPPVQSAPGRTVPDAGADATPRADAPSWARRLGDHPQVARGLGTAAHAVRSSERAGGSASGPSLRDDAKP